MTRQARIDAPDALHHIICRGIERGQIFLDDADRDHFVQRLAAVLSETSTSCFAWALIPNHFHLLVRTGSVPISVVMRRLLTGYSVHFNRRHHRSGHLFQNRYKSILCQQDPYLLELVRYIHLNPLRARIISDLSQLDRYPYSGHSRLVGTIDDGWQDTESVLMLFAESVRSARTRYADFVESGHSMGRRPELTGGGLVRSAGGWSALQALRQTKDRMKSDERILGDSDFVESALVGAREAMERKYRLKSLGCDLGTIVTRVSQLFDVPETRIKSSGKEPDRVKAKSVAAYWAVKELGMAGTEVGNELSLTQSAVSRAVRRGEEIVREFGLSIIDDGNA
ncbi:transposase [Desulforhabdus sp. TSK]|uniref:transposase n=1 Tax=Desulforhabdus sp. TSK TaxID=2925014 RepID=UPI001FC87FDB|nr:transposase [Desulforhabdus sp. TSK]GKT09515.1 transposase [Desulforhabdus sp. TSK]